jgi:prephenate dehydrogenase
MNAPETGLPGGQATDLNQQDRSVAWPQSDYPRRVAIIGVGLLGGSFGLAIRREFPECHLVGVSRNGTSRDAAIARGAIHEATDDIQAACRDADLIVVSTPVDRVADIILGIADVCPEDAILTDLGSTKAAIVSAVQSSPSAGAKFVGAHPIAGGEKTGAQHARDDLFVNRTVVLTPTDVTDPARLQTCEHLWQRLGSRVVMMSPQDHDQAVATISHVPHLVASLLVELPNADSLRLAGTGWLGTTRVASGDPEMWTAICQANRLAIADELARLGAAVQNLRNAILTGDDAEVMRFLDQAKRSRDAVVNPVNDC